MNKVFFKFVPSRQTKWILKFNIVFALLGQMRINVSTYLAYMFSQNSLQMKSVQVQTKYIGYTWRAT